MGVRCTRFRGRRGQSVVETMLLVPLILMLFVSMYYLFTITFAAQNAHMRAREYLLHEDTYLGSRSQGTRGGSVWSATDNNYKNAGRGISSFHFEASSRDRSISGTSSGGVAVEASAVITSN